LETVDPALAAAVEALIEHDPTVASDPELAELCRQVAEATVVDPAERAAVTSEVIALQREGVELSTVIPQEVRNAAREELAQVQSQMQERLETLRTTDPEAARELELMIREGEQCLLAFESGEQYVPSTEMVAHAQQMFNEWEAGALAEGAPQAYIDRARTEFALWSSGEMHEFMVGPGPEMLGPGGTPSLEHMEAMVAAGQMTPEQLQMAQEYMQSGAFEQFGPGGYEHVGPGTFEMYAPSGYEQLSPMEAFQAFEAAAGSFVSPEAIEQYREMAVQYQAEFENHFYDSNQQQIQTQFSSSETPLRFDIHNADHNGDAIAEAHQHPIFQHSDGTCHDHDTGQTVSC
jgi:hypothetical protein